MAGCAGYGSRLWGQPILIARGVFIAVRSRQQVCAGDAQHRPHRDRALVSGARHLEAVRLTACAGAAGYGHADLVSGRDRTRRRRAVYGRLPDPPGGFHSRRRHGGGVFPGARIERFLPDAQWRRCGHPLLLRVPVLLRHRPRPLGGGRFGEVTLVVLIGASGSGKTTIARAVASRCGAAAAVFHFDSIGVPPVEEMVRQHGTGEAWKRAKTIEWMLALANETKAGLPVLLVGQTRFSFLAEGAVAAGGLVYDPILVDCDDDTRSRRLRLERERPELDNGEMMNWARYLRQQAYDGGHMVLDTSALSVSESVERVMDRLNMT